MKWTNSQNLVLQGFLSIVGASIVGFGQAAFQYIFTANNGHIDIRAALAFALTAFGFIFGNALKQYIPAHARELAQAGNDTQAQIQAGFDGLWKRLIAHIGQASTTTPPVVNVAPPIVNVPPAPAPIIMMSPGAAQSPGPQAPVESMPQVPFPREQEAISLIPTVQTASTPPQAVGSPAPVSTYDLGQGQFVPQPGTVSPDDTLRIAAVGK